MEITLGNNIKELRIKMGLTQERLASYLGVSFQAISKWEHGETYPDICMLPAIASFFYVTTDYLLCVDRSKRDETVKSYILKYEKLWSECRYDEVRTTMKKAIEEIPGDFTLLVRYLNSLIWCSMTGEKEALSAKKEIEEIYSMIQDRCTVDSIRIWAKKLVCQYYFKLANIENSGISYNDIKSILSEMPLMQNSRDYLSCIYYAEKEEQDLAVKKLVSEAVYILCRAVDNFHNSSDKSNDDKIRAYESIANVLNSVYPDSDYGKNYINAATIYAKLAYFCKKAGDTAKAEQYMIKSRETAQSFDKQTDILTHTSPLVQGDTIYKSKIPMAQGEPLSARIEKLFST